MPSSKLMERLGLAPQDFEPKDNDSAQRIADIEDALMELAEIITEVQNG